MFVVQISLLIVTFLTLVSRILSLMQTTKETTPHPRIVPGVNMWSVTFFYHLLNVGACICHIPHEGHVEWTTPTEVRGNEFKFHSVTRYTDSRVSCIHVNTTNSRNITCTLVATCVILRSLVRAYNTRAYMLITSRGERALCLRIFLLTLLYWIGRRVPHLELESHLFFCPLLDDLDYVPTGNVGAFFLFISMCSPLVLVYNIHPRFQTNAYNTRGS